MPEALSPFDAHARIVRMCSHPECVPPYRRFFFSEEEADRWSCPDHGRAKVVVQANRPYSEPVVED